MLTNGEILQQLAEEAAYSAKGHFKTADWLRIALSFYIMVPLTTSLVIFVFTLSDTYQRFLSFIGVLFSIIALSSSLASNRDKANRLIQEHMDLGNKYLSLYKEIRNLASEGFKINSKKLSELQNEISGLDNQTKRLRISLMGRLWAKLRIMQEIDLDWVYKNR